MHIFVMTSFVRLSHGGAIVFSLKTDGSQQCTEESDDTETPAFVVTVTRSQPPSSRSLSSMTTLPNAT